jgi:hypothetical protein
VSRHRPHGINLAAEAAARDGTHRCKSGHTGRDNCAKKDSRRRPDIADRKFTPPTRRYCPVRMLFGISHDASSTAISGPSPRRAAVRMSEMVTGTVD